MVRRSGRRRTRIQQWSSSTTLFETQPIRPDTAHGNVETWVLEWIGGWSSGHSAPWGQEGGSAGDSGEGAVCRCGAEWWGDEVRRGRRTSGRVWRSHEASDWVRGYHV